MMKDVVTRKIVGIGFEISEKYRVIWSLKSSIVIKLYFYTSYNNKQKPAKSQTHMHISENGIFPVNFSMYK